MVALLGILLILDSHNNLLYVANTFTLSIPVIGSMFRLACNRVGNTGSTGRPYIQIYQFVFNQSSVILNNGTDVILVPAAGNIKVGGHLVVSGNLELYKD